MDLLLDTICNTFGGVLFIALLVVMLVQTSPAGRSQPSPVSDSTAAEQLAQQRLELDSLTDELARVQAARSGQLRTLASLAPNEMRRLLEERGAKEAKAQSLGDERTRLEALVARLADGASAARSAAATTKADRQRTQAEVERLQKELASAKASKLKELRTPVAKRPGLRNEVAIIIQYGRLYVWHRYDSLGNRRGLNTDDFLVVERSSTGLETTPRPTGGIPIANTPEARQELAAAIRRFQPARHYPSFVVRPDSFDEFEVVRDVAVDLGFEYRLMPLEADASIVDRGGSGGFVQ